MRGSHGKDATLMTSYEIPLGCYYQIKIFQDAEWYWIYVLTENNAGTAVIFNGACC